MVEVARGDIWWADLATPYGSEPGYRRPVLVIQAAAFNQSRIRTVLVAVITSNVALAGAPGNVLVPLGSCGLNKDSVVNVSQVVTVDRSRFSEQVGELPGRWMKAVDDGLRMVMAL